METFAKNWEEWIDLNMKLGNCRRIMFQKSLDQGYSYDLVSKKLGISYKVEPNHSANTDTITLRIAQKIHAKHLELYTIPGFLTPDECKQIITLIDAEDLIDSSTFNASNPTEKQVNTHRTSKTCYFKNTNTFIQSLENRICKTIGLNNRFAEKIQGQKYTIGQEFKSHTDYFDPVVLKENKTINGQRTWTFMIYLNDVEEGGYTSFPNAFASTKPVMGTAVIWNNLTASHKENIFSTHCGMPILAGEKYILTKWFKDTEINFEIPNAIQKNDGLPIFHPVGFEKKRIESKWLDAIRDWVKEHEAEFQEEPIDHTDANAELLDIHKAPKEFVEGMEQEIKTLLTKWIEYKTELVHTATYGVRNYLRGSSSGTKYEKIQTHILSAIVHIGDTSDKPWELYIEDHTFRPHRIVMEYGDILLYESATCLHGRPSPFEGESFRNMYFHFKPIRM